MRKIAFWLSLLLIFTIPWENSVIVEGVGRISRVFGLGVGAFWMATVLSTGKFRQLRPFHLVCFLFFLWNGITALWSTDLDSTVGRVVTYVQLATLMWLLWDLYLTKEAMRAGLQAYVLGAYVSVLATISNYLAGITAKTAVRYAASGFGVNGLAMMLVLGLPLAWYLAVTLGKSDDRRQYLLRIVNFAYIPLAVFAILLTASRTALFSMLPVFWFMLGSSTRLKPAARFFVTIALMGAVYILQPLVPQTSLDRLATAQTEITEGGDLSGRQNIWREAAIVFWEDPILGVGSGAFREAVAFKDKVAHNTYISILVETGLVGFILFSLVVATAAYHILGHPKWEAGFWLALLMAWLIGSYTATGEARKTTWLMLSMIVISANAYRQLADVSRQPARVSKSARLTLPTAQPRETLRSPPL